MPRTISFVPKPLFLYESSFELVTIMRDAIQAHAAYHKAGVLHGHIAPQNIMFVCSGSGDEEVTSGILIDLDSAVCWEEQPSGQLSQNKQDEGTKGG